VIGGLLPNRALSLTFGPHLVAVTADLLIAGGVMLAVTTRQIPKMAGAVLAATTARVLVVGNGTWTPPWQALTILALMFTGTMLRRAERGEYSMRRARLVALAVFATVIGGGLWHGQSWHSGAALAQWEHQWVTSLVLAGATFALGMACRHRRVPRLLTWLGLVSYSVYVLHPLLIGLYRRIPAGHGPPPLPVQLMLTAAFLAVLLGCCALTYRLLEVPAQRQGRALAAWLEARFGPDRPPRQAQAQAQAPGQAQHPAGMPGSACTKPQVRRILVVMRNQTAP
jgi:peptidoglycan/LPS O-acetylase OafA/YrhL